MTATAVRRNAAAFVARLDQVPPRMLPLVAPLLLVVLGAAVIAVVAVLAAVLVVAASAVVVLLGRRAIHAAATYNGKAVTA
ncbi:hypothetical protein [Streptomyces sp. CAI-85]|uniref:hypothetical protein n=1 Tax=Streptomyces sp. CAI-85 TaxID=1472662 RepID=UPI0015871090|nr:hypothetical protein [Streptomyces sp. CAI-85]NUV64287.1 hypothetical protein [Streptomyces sp. CAI-85]